MPDPLIRAALLAASARTHASPRDLWGSQPVQEEQRQRRQSGEEIDHEHDAEKRALAEGGRPPGAGAGVDGGGAARPAARGGARLRAPAGQRLPRGVRGGLRGDRGPGVLAATFLVQKFVPRRSIDGTFFEISPAEAPR